MNESGRRTAATLGLIAASAAGAIGVTSLTHSETMVSDTTFTDSAGPTGFFQGTGVVTTTSQAPGINGAPVRKSAAGAGSHTKAHGS
jgi:hypothetical protein